MFKSLFGSKETLEFNFSDCQIYKTKYNNKSASKISFYREINIGDIGEIYTKVKSLATVNSNILPIFRMTAHSVFTKKVIPFSSIYSESNREFNKFVMFKIINAIDILHSNHISHNNIKLESIFIDEIGNPLLGNFILAQIHTFDNSSHNHNNQDDILLECTEPNSLAKNSTNIQPVAQQFHKNSDVISYGTPEFTSHDITQLNNISQQIINISTDKIKDEGIYFDIEHLLSDLRTMDIIEKRKIMDKIIMDKFQIIDFVKKNIFSVFICELSRGDIEKPFKLEILEFLKELDDGIFAKNLIKLFKVIDTSVRFYLLTNINEIDNLDGAVEEIGLGLRVKDKSLKLETISFIFKNEINFSEQSMNRFVEIMTGNISDSDSIGIICQNFLGKDTTSIPIAYPRSFYRNIYKLFVSFLLANKNKPATYSCLEKYFPFFDKYKLSSELLPLLCSKLSDKEAQDKCFGIIEKILKYLKANKDDIENKEWSVKNLAGIFKAKLRTSEQNLKDKIDKMKVDEWEDQEI